MKKFSLSMVLILLMSVLVLGATGCAAQDKMELLNALEKTADIRSFESHSSFEIEKVTLDSTIEDAAMVEPFISMFEGLKMDLHRQTYQNTEQTILKSQMDMDITLQGTTENTSMWLDYDFTATPPKMEYIIKLPASALGMIPGTEVEQEYLHIDESELLEAGDLPTEAYTETLQEIKDAQTEMINLIKQYAIDKNPNFVVVTQLPDRTVNGENHKVYQLKLTNDNLKALLRYMAAEMPQDEETKETLKEFIMTTMFLTEGTEAGMDFSDSFEKFRDGTTTFSEDINATLDVLDDVTMLGENGIVIDYLVNSQGYIVSEVGSVDLFMSTQQIDDALEKLSPTGDYPASNQSEFMEATVTLGLKFSSETSRINENITIEYPTLTPENTINFDDFTELGKAGAIAIKQQVVNSKHQAAPTTIQASSSAVKYDVKPITIGEHVILPLEEVCKNLGITYKKNKDGSYSISNGKKTIHFTSNSNEITINKSSASLSLPVMRIENRLFVPAEFVERYLGGSVKLNKNDHSASVIKK